MYESRTDVEVLVLLHRKGFVRLAMEAGACLVPIYCFGNTSAFKVRRVWWGTSGLYLFLFPLLIFPARPPPPAVKDLARKARVSLPSFWGRYGLPIPFRVKILVAVGAPLVAAPGETIDSFHERYCDALRGLFERHKAAAGPEWVDKKLEYV